MNSEYLHEFLTVVSRMNFSEAAKHLNMGQSAISKHIAALEKEFDCTLFQRNPSGIELTCQGRIFCTEAQRMLNSIKQTKERLQSVSTEVRLAGSTDDGAIVRLLAEATKSMSEKDASFSFSVERSNSQPLVVQLLSNLIDLCFLVDIEGEEMESLCESCGAVAVPLVAIVNKRHAFAERSSVSVRDFDGQFIVHPVGGSLDFVRGVDLVSKLFKRNAVSVGQKLFFATSTRDFSFFDIEDSVFVTPRSNFSRQLFPENFDDYCAIPFQEEDAVFKYRLVWRRGESRTQVLAFRDCLLEVSEGIYPLKANA